MSELSSLCGENIRFQNTLKSAIRHFRNCEDNCGLDDFLNSMEDMEIIVSIEQCLGGNVVNIGKMLPVIRQLLTCIQNQDITGLTDVLEFSVYPLSKEWIKGCDQ